MAALLAGIELEADTTARKTFAVIGVERSDQGKDGAIS
jgi:hypothetical protein